MIEYININKTSIVIRNKNGEIVFDSELPIFDVDSIRAKLATSRSIEHAIGLYNNNGMPYTTNAIKTNVGNIISLVEYSGFYNTAAIPYSSCTYKFGNTFNVTANDNTGVDVKGVSIGVI